jgi:hypothetical protein
MDPDRSERAGRAALGLSTIRDGRTVQAEGYVMVAEGGEVALLRAGTGARRVWRPDSASPRILASTSTGWRRRDLGWPTPGAGLNVRVDRPTRGGGADETAASTSLTESLSPGSHDIQVAGEGGENAVSVETSRAAPLTYGPVRASRNAQGWRIDWMTPAAACRPPS